MAGRSPGMQRPDAGKNGEADEQKRKDPVLELRGKLSLAADVTRDADGLFAIDSRGDAENVLIRRQITA